MESENNSEIIPFDNLEAVCTQKGTKLISVSPYVRIVPKHYRKFPQRLHIQPDENGEFPTVINKRKYRIVVDGWVTKDAKKKK